MVLLIEYFEVIEGLGNINAVRIMFDHRIEDGEVGERGQQESK